MLPAIRCERIGKQYRIGRTRDYPTLRDALAAFFRHPVRSIVRKPEEPRIWAVRDVSFEVPEGEVLGIIGRNGSGKSTLLRILSRITSPTEGVAHLRGRVGSLLEVGTGFHQELSGRENIYLNGAILGMKRREIERRFDEIVAFAELEQFLDTPIKHYSTGMYVRLAFAVAAHLDTEILLVDEILAVGDSAFQKKSLNAMGQFSQKGRTVVFVSHDMDAVRRLCHRVMWIDDGSMRMLGDPQHCISKYLLSSARDAGEIVFEPARALYGDVPIRLHRVSMKNELGEAGTRFSRETSIAIEIEWENGEDLDRPRIGFVLETGNGADVLTARDLISHFGKLPAGRRISRCAVPPRLLNEGEYVVEVVADTPLYLDLARASSGALLRFEIEDHGSVPNRYYGEGFRDNWPGVLLLDLSWSREEVSGASKSSVDQSRSAAPAKSGR